MIPKRRKPTVNNSADFLKSTILVDSEGIPSVIVGIRGAESGLDHIEIMTQSTTQKEYGVATRWRLYNTEILTEKGLEMVTVNTRVV